MSKVKQSDIQSEESSSVPEIPASPQEESPMRDSPIDGTTGESPINLMEDSPIEEEEAAGLSPQEMAGMTQHHICSSLNVYG